MDFYDSLLKLIEVEAIIKGDQETRDSVVAKLSDAAKKKRKKVIRTSAGKDKDMVTTVSQNADKAAEVQANQAAAKLGIR